MSGVGRGRGAVLPAWMTAKGLDAPAAPGAAPQNIAPAVSNEIMPSIGSKRTFETVNKTNVSSPATSVGATAATAAAALPPGWHESFDPHYQRNYYYNYDTGERSWIKPESGAPNTSAPAPIATKPAPAPTTTTSSLPASARWEMAIDPARGKPYYYNHATGESAWVLPQGATLLATAAAPAAAAVPSVPAKRQREEEPEEGEVNNLAFHTATTTAATASPAKPALDEEVAEPLPPGWSRAEDPSSGKTYYYNETLGITQWYHPTSIGSNEPDNREKQKNADNNNESAAGGGGVKPQQQGTRLNTNSNKNKNQPALDPMDPSSYSDAPRGGWGAGLGKETDM